MWEFWASVLPVLILLALGYSVGSWRERRHLADLDRREAELFTRITCNNLKRITNPQQVRQAALVMGEVVVASDYFKTFAAHLRNLIGGEVKSFDTLMLRARREAVLRMLESARALGATEVWNMRLGTSSISGMQPKNPAVSVEVFAFGTAVVRG
jgi:uncharacterized protein YbjQ (UPF0145 family)